MSVNQECKEVRRLIKNEAGEGGGCQPMKDKKIFECYLEGKILILRKFKYRLSIPLSRCVNYRCFFSVNLREVLTVPVVNRAASIFGFFLHLFPLATNIFLLLVQTC